ncbi:hypothetical protein [uncultured Photobacterium sp.]|uniref:hypothetical protein n=1 Tax=uncultured Photobacterium sp. TaxID=173973 RepID=UPI00260A5A30|nr:hypothetical protein [uncultured Photobacterium sp.]
MQFNLIIVLFAFAALALDKLSMFDDKPERYVNAPVDISPSLGPSMERVNAQSTSTKKQPVVNKQVANKQALSVPGESNSADQYEQKMFPTMHQVVLGSVVVPVEY